uniref:F-box domain-containing protein n=1 Tax=Chenopodium quinoa TaxID=63459 RepID=A0A803MHP0_CHEQI
MEKIISRDNISSFSIIIVDLNFDDTLLLAVLYKLRHGEKLRLSNLLNNKNLEGDQSDKVDLISSLPDDILVYLLSFVGIKAAARTSLLSKRWRHVWTYITDLDFEDPPRLAIAITKPYENSEAGNYADWVNQVIRANQAQYLNTFRMHFSIPFGDKIYASNIDKWLEFACTKKVRNLELHMGTLPTIPIFKNPTFVLNTSLVSLYLTKVVVDGPLLQWVLSNCLKLGRLMLHSCMATDDVFASSKRQKLVISSLTLKHLEIFHSTRLLNTESLHIVAPNLVTLLFIESPTVDLEYVSVPSLVDAAFGGIYSTKLCNGSFLSGLSSQLEKLSLHWFKYNHTCFDPICYGSKYGSTDSSVHSASKATNHGTATKQRAAATF